MSQPFCNRPVAKAWRNRWQLPGLIDAGPHDHLAHDLGEVAFRVACRPVGQEQRRLVDRRAQRGPHLVQILFRPFDGPRPMGTTRSFRPLPRNTRTRPWERSRWAMSRLASSMRRMPWSRTPPPWPGRGCRRVPACRWPRGSSARPPATGAPWAAVFPYAAGPDRTPGCTGSSPRRVR